MSAVSADQIDALESELKRQSRQRLFVTVTGISITAAIVVFGVDYANRVNASPFSQGITRLFDYPIDMFVEAYEGGLANFFVQCARFLPDLISTINIAIFSTAIGFVMAAILACIASANLIKNRTVVWITRRFLDLFRSFPELVIAKVLLFLMGFNLIPVVVAITIHTAGALGKLFSEAIENADEKPLDGLKSVGASWTQRILFGLFPQVMPSFYSYGLLRLEINVRASTILGFVGAGGIGQALYTSIQLKHGDEVMAIMFMLVLTIVALDYFSGFVRNRVIGVHA
ncbi:MAG: phosphonate ABC transporter, permease protein PhnE, partial [Pseudomonadota bacterium]